MKTKILVDLHIECEPDSYVGRWCRTIEQRAKELESWCKEFEEFVRDHRSRDCVSLNVVREYQEQCSHCGYEWEVDEKGVPVCCQKAIDEHESVFVAMGMKEPEFPTLIDSVEKVTK